MILVACAASLPSLRAADLAGDERVSTALKAGPGAMAEPAVAIDPSDPDHFIAAADPYLAPVRIVVRESNDGGETWSEPIDVVPPAFSKSYDPSVAVLTDGRVVVVGGASQEGAAHCQPGSAVFLAELRDGPPRYSLIQQPQDGVYVDRPQMIADPRSGAMFVSWTRSAGTGAECLAAPLRSSIMFTRSLSGRTFSPATSLPSTGFPAPFGSSMTVGDDGSVHVATREAGMNGTDRIIVVSSDDGGGSFSSPTTIAETAAFPGSISGLGGFTSGVPVIAAGPRGVAVAWPRVDDGGSRLEVALRPTGGAWHRLRPLGTRAGYEIFPGVSYDGAGRLWLLYARYSAGTMTFILRHRAPRGWSSPRTIAAGPAGGYVEVGQFSALAASGERIVAAVPVDGAASRLTVFSKLLDAPPPSSLSADPGPPDAREPGPAATPRPESRLRSTLLLLLGGGLVGAIVLRRLRRSSRNAS